MNSFHEYSQEMVLTDICTRCLALPVQYMIFREELNKIESKRPLFKNIFTQVKSYLEDIIDRDPPIISMSISERVEIDSIDYKTLGKSIDLGYITSFRISYISSNGLEFFRDLLIERASPYSRLLTLLLETPTGVIRYYCSHIFAVDTKGILDCIRLASVGMCKCGGVKLLLRNNVTICPICLNREVIESTPYVTIGGENGFILSRRTILTKDKNTRSNYTFERLLMLWRLVNLRLKGLDDESIAENWLHMVIEGVKPISFLKGIAKQIASLGNDFKVLVHYRNSIASTLHSPNIPIMIELTRNLMYLQSPSSDRIRNEALSILREI